MRNKRKKTGTKGYFLLGNSRQKRTNRSFAVTPWVLGNMECVMWGYVGVVNRPTFIHYLCINNIFSRLDFECSDGCFPKMLASFKH